MRFALSLLLTTCLIVPAIADDKEAWRLFIADHADPIVSAIDLETGDTLETFSLASPALLYPAGTNVFAVQGTTNQVSAIRSGISFEDHGGHADIAIESPSLVETPVEGDRPVHLVPHGDRIAIFFDGSGAVSLVDSHDWLAGTPAPITLESGAPHHGVAVPWKGGAIVSKPVAEDGKLPTGFTIFDASGAVQFTTELCADVHGEAASGSLVAFGCSDGVLIASGDASDFLLLPYDGLPEGRVGALLGGTNMEYFLGNYGAKAVALIDPAADDPFRLIELPFARVDFKLDDRGLKSAYLLLANGAVHELNVLSGTLGRSVSVTEPYATDGGHGAAMPRLAVAGDVIAVSDPTSGKVHLVDIDSFAVTGAIDIGGTPSSIVAVGGTGASH